MTDGPRKIRVGEALIARGALTEEQLQKALATQEKSGQRIGEVLVAEGMIEPSALVRTLSDCLKVRGCVLRHGMIDPAMLKLVGDDEAKRLKVLPMFRVRETLYVAMAEPQTLPTIDALRRRTGLRIQPIFSLEPDIIEFIRKYSGENVGVDEFLATLQESDVEVVEREAVDEGVATDIEKMVDGSPVVNIVNLALLTAVRDGSSDIHVEPSRSGTRIRYRIDGALRDLMTPPFGMHAAIVSRIKVISQMDIAEKRLPQEGRVRIVVEGRGIDLRVSSMPTLLGEKLAVRILDKDNLRIRLEDLGFRTEPLTIFKRMLRQPYGLVLVTGPTGSGKTTTLYSALDLLSTPELNFVTVEDPVEYQLDMINQIHVNEAIGLSFARALRSILRQDPDVIMVGEIRDHETARVGVQAAMTGHLVLATLHTNDAPGAASRLIEMGTEPYLLSGALNGVAAQRLVRTVCKSCVTKYYPTESVLGDAGLAEETGRSFSKGVGCDQCHNSGFHGRIAIYELMETTGSLRRFIHRGAGVQEIREKLRELGVPSLREEGVRLALSQATSLEEVLRATQMEDEAEVVTLDGPGEVRGGLRERKGAA